MPKSDSPSLPAVFGKLPTNAGWQPALPKQAKETARGGKPGPFYV